MDLQFGLLAVMMTKLAPLGKLVIQDDELRNLDPKKRITIQHNYDTKTIVIEYK